MTSLLVETSTNRCKKVVGKCSKKCAIYHRPSTRVTWEGCPRYKSTKICAHSLAVAEKCNKLQNFLTWFKRSSHTLTTTSYVTCDSAPTVGKKSQKPSTSRRKGGRGQAISIVPRPNASEQA